MKYALRAASVAIVLAGCVVPVFADMGNATAFFFGMVCGMIGAQIFVATLA